MIWARRLSRDSPDELGSGANCGDFLDCLEVPTRDKGDFRHSRLLHGVRGSVSPFLRGIRTHSSRWLPLMHEDRTSHAGADGGSSRSSAISRKISWIICRGIATSAIWNTM